MEAENIVCPVCTLYLRPGITLKQHLTSHPKQKVIDALVNLASSRGDVKELAVMNSPTMEMGSNNSQVNQHQWTQPVTGFPPMPTSSGNHSFIYQQFMSTTSQPPHVVSVNPLGQQYITIPTVFNPQMMCQPYMYQQQQVIMSAGSTAAALPSMIRKPAVIDLSEDCEESQNKDVVTVEDDLLNNSYESPDEPKDEDKDLVDETINLTNVEETSLMDDVAMLNTLNTEHEIKSDDEMEEEKGIEEEKLDEEEERLEDEEEERLEDEDEERLREEEDEKGDEDVEQIGLEEEEVQHIEDNLGSPASSVGSDYLRVRTDLNKACQTQVPQINLVDTEAEEMQEQMYFSTQPSESHPAISPKLVAVQERDLNNIMQQTDQIIDMDGMQLVLCNDFMGSQLISQVEDFECINNRTERTVLMNIGGMDGGFANTFNESNVNMDELAEESISRDESTNMSIRADEHMPPRGELSGQESNGAASDITWTRIHYEVNSATSTSYDLIAQETWDGSNCSESEAVPMPMSAPPAESYNPELDDTPTIVSVIEPPLNFKCPTCGKGFKCPKERKEHQAEVHGDKIKSESSTGESESNSEKININLIGSKLGKKQVKKLVIKPKKPTEIKSENNFDNVFTNKIKPDNNLEIEGKVEKVESRMSVIAAVTSECDIEDKKERYCICHICEAVLPDNKALKRHKVHSHGKTFSTRFKCDICEENLLTEKKYNEHLRKHPLECRLCGKYFYRRPNLQLHMKRHLGIKPHCCDFCQKSFLTKQKLDEHKNVHTGEAPIKCNMCEETFKRHSNLVQHRNRHHLNIKHKVKDYICFCGEILHSKKKLAWHKEIHDVKPKACAHCSEKFVHMASLTRHMRRAHNERFVPKEDRLNENVQCPICKGVYLKSSLDVHMRKHSGQRPFSCLICNKDFTTKWNLKLHKWTHAARASKPFKCDQCKGAFIRESDYIAHMNSHKSIRPYTCNHCGAQFIRKYNCQRHVKEHENAKTFACQICGKSFHRSYYLKDHMKVHSGVRPYSCHICGKTSTTKSNHNKHVMIHHAKEPVSTEN